VRPARACPLRFRYLAKPGLVEMQVITDAKAMRRWSQAHRAAGRSVSLVPTMGYLHLGHLSLVKEALSRSDVCVVSIYVNPAQFAANEDFGTYPRDEQGDLRKLKELGVHAVFMPERLYVVEVRGDKIDGDEENLRTNSPASNSPETNSPVSNSPPETKAAHETYVTAEQLQVGLCSKTRPHFFRGVATVVAKLFNICEPDVAVFGKKDYQQLRVVQRVVRDLDFAIDVVGAPLERETDGLAMSSRNARLTADHRANALAISRGLLVLKNKVATSHRGLDEQTLANEVREIRTGITEAGGEVDYVEVCDQESLVPVKTLPAGAKAVCLVAAKFGDVRLLDNAELGGEA
jgi:pantoate--beta-alanine ligase